MKVEKLTKWAFMYKLEWKEDVFRMTKWMPNMKDLTMVLDDKQLSIVCREWTGLKNLTVAGDDLTDEGIAGITAIPVKDGAEGQNLESNGNNISLLSRNWRYLDVPEVAEE